ncbi:MAG: glycosyltransferase family 39 protein [Anaerolineae bacterium]|nr:glycosyltransferase family 39 protein [Anaerolineae bacterium]
MWNLDTQSLWHDEAWSVMSAYQPLTPIDPNYPPFFTVLLGVWIRLVGDSVWAMRYWSLLFGVATVAVMAIVARRWFGDRAAIIAAIMITVSPILWVFAQEIRSYVLVPLLALVLLALAGKIVQPHPLTPSPQAERGNQTCRIWLWLALTEIMLLYTHNLSVPIVAWLNVTVIAALLFRRDWRQLRTWLLVQIGLLILYLPWLITQRPTGTPLNTPPTVSPALVWDIWQSYFTGIKALVGVEPGLMALVAVFGVVGVVSIGAAVGAGLKPAPTSDPRKQRLLLALSQAILIPIFEIIIILAAHIDFHPRYFIVGVPATLLLIAVGLDRLAQRGVLLRVAAVGATALAVGIGVYMARLVYGNPAYQHDDFRAIAQHYAQLGPDDAIIIPYGWEPTLDYYSRKLNFKAKMIGTRLHDDGYLLTGTLLDSLQGVKHAELLTWYQLPADVRGAYPCVLGTLGKQVGDSFTVFGLKTDRYDVVGIRRILGLDPRIWIDFGDIQVQYPLQLWGTGTDSLCIIVTWELPRRTQQDWRTVVRLINNLGWELGKADNVILSNEQLPTSLWMRARQTGTTFSFLKLPAGVPPDLYSVRLSVYSQQTPQGLTGVRHSSLTGDSPPSTDVYLGSALKDTVSPLNVQPTDADMPLNDHLYLHRKDIPTASNLVQGQDIPVTLEWWQVKAENSVYLNAVLEGQDWRQSSPVYIGVSDFDKARLLSWHSFRVPASAAGKATLKVIGPDNKTIILGEYDITPIARTFTEPAAANRVSATFAGVGTLIGYTSPDAIKSGEALPITLYWKPSTTPPTTLKVFVHLLAGKDYSNGIIAQSDAEPAGGQRPTTSWVAGEYITDPHMLTFNNPGYTGPAALSIGLYDATTGKRVLLDNGDDHIVLPITVMVK